MTKIIVAGVLLCTSQISYCQKKADANFLFKMWLYIEHVNRNLRTENDFPVKDSALFALYQTAINLKFDTLSSKGFLSNYIFLSIVPAKNNKIVNDSAITYNQTKHLSYVSVPVDNCDGYILGINNNSGKSYRLQGFYGNDFLSLLQEVREEYYKINSKKLSVKQFLKQYSVRSVEFGCIYKGLCSGEKDTDKYPCLRNCSDLIITIH